MMRANRGSAHQSLEMLTIDNVMEDIERLQGEGERWSMTCRASRERPNHDDVVIISE